MQTTPEPTATHSPTDQWRDIGHFAVGRTTYSRIVDGTNLTVALVPRGGPRSEANTALIASAPALLRQRDALAEACRRFLDRCVCCKMDAGPDMIDGATWDDVESLRSALASLGASS